ncbi:MAG: SNF2-related protein [Bulleidia sp.]
MITEKVIEKLVPEKIRAMGRRVHNSGLVYDLSIWREPTFTSIRANVESEQSYATSYDVSVILSKDNEWIVDQSCTCQYFEDRYTTCKHIAAVLYETALVDETNLSPVSVQPKPRNTDRNALNLMEAFEHAPEDPIGDGEVVLMPQFNGSGDRLNSMVVEMRIGVPGKSNYVVKSIDDLIERILNQDIYTYGKKLAFTHTRTAFSRECQPMIDFLLTLHRNENSYKASTYSYASSWYYQTDYSRIGRYLSLKGFYLDQFMDAYAQMADQDYCAVKFNDQADYRPEVSVTKEKDGIVFTCSALPYYEGQKYIYVPDRYLLLRIRKDHRLTTLMNYGYVTDGKQNFVSENDLPSFTSAIWPSLQKHAKLLNNGFDPAPYMPDRPYFEIYLDLDNSGAITARVVAIYKHGRYDVLKDREQAGYLRDLSFEKQMISSIRRWFDDMDVRDEMLKITDDEKIFNFMSEGVNALKDRAEVFISDRLKRLKVRRSSGVSVGVSTGVDLLQLEMFSSDLSNQEIAEILGKYSEKKRFYRLKNGSLIQTDESFDELYEMKENLNFSLKDLSEGTAKLPLYRAMYLNQLSQKVSMNMAKDNAFESMIQRINTIQEKEYDLPSGLTVELRPYQAEGYRWLCALKDNHFGGLLADEMGLGKTLQVIALMGSRLRTGRCLVVCPASLVYNWASEIEKFMPELKARIISGTVPEREELIAQAQEDEILITSYDLLKRDIACYEEMTFDIEVIDEAQYIKNAHTSASQSVKAINASFRIALTGTPIENRLSELWSIFDYILPGFFSTYQHFRNQYENPIVKDQDDLVQRDLTAMITPFVLRRLKKDVLKDLPDKLEQIYYAKLEGEQKNLYDAHVQRLKESLESTSDEEFREQKIEILAQLTRLRQICCEPSLLFSNYSGNSAKKDMCLDMIQEAVDAGHKILLFSQFRTMLLELTELMEKRGIRYHLLTGETPKKKRAEMVNAFQNDDVPVFCISLKAGGTGLNLTAADVVIHYDPWWNTAVENQATDRAHRIGQQNVVSVYRLIMKDTIEERIIEMQNMKSDLAEGILSGEGISSSSLTRDDLLAIL